MQQPAAQRALKPTLANSGVHQESDKLTDFLLQWLQKTHPQHGWELEPRSRTSKFFDVPPDMVEKGGKSVLYDDRHLEWTRNLLMGLEWHFLIFYPMFQYCMYLSTGNYAVAVFLVYFLDKVLSWFRIHFGRINLSTKTMVDDKFFL